jgi:hypothetical protein
LRASTIDPQMQPVLLKYLAENCLFLDLGELGC